MKKTAIVACVLIPMLVSMANALDLVSRGQATCRIEISPHESKPLQFAGTEIQRYLEKMTGAKVPIGAQAGQTSMILLRLTPAPSAQAPATRETDSYTLCVDDHTLTIEGGSGRAVLYGVYEVLERLGCRFISLGPEGEEVPQCDSVSLPPMKETFAPAMPYRGLIVQQPINERTLLMADWMAKNRMNYWIEPCGIWGGAKPRMRDALTNALKTRGLIWEYGHHTFAHWITQGKPEPELYGLKGGRPSKRIGGPPASLLGGRRTPEAICVSNPKAVEKVAANMAQFAREHPEVDVVSLWANDGYNGWCECEKCKAIDPNPAPWRGEIRVMSPTYFRFVSEVAAAFKKSCPDKFISVLSYVNTLPRPAGMELPDNVILLTAPIGRNYAKPISAEEYFAGIIKTWNDAHHRPRFFAYEYYAGVYANLSMPFPVLHELSADMKWYREIGFGGLCTQAEEDHWGTYGLNFYALARLSWNPDIPVDPLLAGYCDAFYGPASASMQKYFATMEAAMLAQKDVRPGRGFFRVLCGDANTFDAMGEALASARAQLKDADARYSNRLKLTEINYEYVTLARQLARRDVGQVFDTLPPTPKGERHIGLKKNGEWVQLRFALPKDANKGFALDLGRIVGMSGAGTSYQREVRIDPPDGPLVFEGKKFSGTEEEAREHKPGRAMPKEEALTGIRIDRFLTERQLAQGFVDVFVTIHVEGDGWTVYCDEDGTPEKDMRGYRLDPDAEKKLQDTKKQLIAFVKANAHSGVLSIPDGILQWADELAPR